MLRSVDEYCKWKFSRAFDLESLDPGAAWELSSFHSCSRCIFLYGLHNRREFSDAVYVRYTRAFPNFPLLCACGQPNSINHALNCVKGFVLYRHDQVRDLLANFCSKVVRDVEIEPKLASLNGEVLQTGANTANGTRSD